MTKHLSKKVSTADDWVSRWAMTNEQISIATPTASDSFFAFSGVEAIEVVMVPRL